MLKQGWAALFGGLLLIGMLVTNRIWQADWLIARYDALSLYALGLQGLFLATRVVSRREARVILLFHLTGTAMEVFKVKAGSWAYPGDGVMKLWGVPLFSGFMCTDLQTYSARLAIIAILGPNYLTLSRGINPDYLQPACNQRAEPRLRASWIWGVFSNAYDCLISRPQFV
ncbi:DUF817 family protein [Shimia abyssi]|nr:DUF817 family protein [Shimia abyssi]